MIVSREKMARAFAIIRDPNGIFNDEIDDAQIAVGMIDISDQLARGLAHAGKLHAARCWDELLVDHVTFADEAAGREDAD